MGISDVVRSRIGEAVAVLTGKSGPAPGVSWEAPVIQTQYGTTEWQISSLLEMNPEQLWRSQPNLRMVVGFIARNIAQLRLQMFERVSDTDRKRDTTSAAAQLLRHPNEDQTQYEFMTALISQVALWDNGYLWLSEDANRESGWRMELLSPAWTTKDPHRNVYRTTRKGHVLDVPAAQVQHFHGWSPLYVDAGTSPVDTLRDVLREQIAAVQYRQQRWESGARVGTYLYRPAAAPPWSPAAQEKFADEWRDKWSGNNAADGGGEPLLQDGMELRKIGFTAVEDEYIDAAKLALTVCAAAYFINPVMIGLLDNANYSNVREFRRMLYGDTLGPWLTFFEDRFNGFVLPQVGAGDTTYVEFNVAEKLQGSFEEQAVVMSTMVGRPIMTANEARSRFNLPAVDDPGADELITPMNVTVGGQPSPQTPVEDPAPAAPPEGASAAPAGTDPVQLYQHPSPQQRSAQPQPERRPVRGKSGGATKEEHDDLERALVRFLDRQQRTVLSAMGAEKKRRSADWGWVQRKDDDEEPDDPPWWNGERWDRELTAIVKQDALQVSGRIGTGAYPDYSTARTEDYFEKFAQARATNINRTTMTDLVEADDADDDDEEADTPEDVFSKAKTDRVPGMAVTMLTAVSGFAVVEAGKQKGGDSTKTWIVNNPNSRHPEMNGETVPVQDNFSNGAAWPGDASLDVDETAGCLCTLELND